MDNTYRHPIRVVSLRTGLSPHVIRAWERRYKAIRPQRSGTNRRLYSDDDIYRLQLLRKATLGGHNIGQVARLSNDELSTLVAEGQAYGSHVAGTVKGSNEDGSPRSHLESAIDAVMALDSPRLEDMFSKALVRFSQPTVLEEFLLPLMTYVGDGWQRGALKIVHEHLASVVVRNFLGGLSTAYVTHASSPAVVVATPSGQLHEFGALAVAATAGAMGWRVFYLGPSLPAEEIAAAVEAHHAQAVALSVVYPGEDPRVGQEIQKLRRLVGTKVGIIVGGRVAQSYAEAAEASGAVVIADLHSLRVHLDTLTRSRTA